MIIQHLKKSERRGSTGNGMEYLQQLVGVFKHSKKRLPSRFGQCLGGKSPKFKNLQNPEKKALATFYHIGVTGFEPIMVFGNLIATS